MSDDNDTCKFGHVFEVHGSSPVKSGIETGEIKTLDDVVDEVGTDFFPAFFGDSYKHLKVSAGSQGMAYGVVLSAPDKFNDDLDYAVDKVSEKIFVSPQNQMHQQFVQRKKEAESNIKDTMRNISELKKQKHMLEHDIRKLRSRAEAFDSRDETLLKADFVELVDGRGGGAQQGAEEAPLKTLRDQNIYPTIVADFNEMESIDDLKSEENGGTGKLADLPRNERAILKKKWSMYERWKDLYGSEVKRKLNEIKSELNSIERSINETRRWLEPYVRDMTMIHQKERSDYYDEFTKYYTLQGYASLERNLEFICYRGLKNTGDDLLVTDDEDEITHYRVIHIHAVHVNLAGGEQPQSPADGPSTAVVFWRPAIVCKHVFNRIVQPKIDKQKNQFDALLEDYTGEFVSEEGEELKEARQEKELDVRMLREKIEEELDREVPLELSSKIRRIEDGLDSIHDLEEEYVDAIDQVLDTSFSDESDEDGEEIYTGIEKTLREFTGQVDQYKIPSDVEPLKDLKTEMKFNYYYDFKLGLGLFTMK